MFFQYCTRDHTITFITLHILYLVNFLPCFKMKIYLQLALEIWKEVIIEPIKEKLVAELLAEIKRFVKINEYYNNLIIGN